MVPPDPVPFDDARVAAEAWGVSLPKAGHTAAENEDAFALHATGQWPIHAAVADGATESAFARAWADTLVQGYATGSEHIPQTLAKRLPDWQAAWQREAEVRSADLPWYAAAKAEEGAFAALLGLTLYRSGAWRAASVGDCCLFHVRDGAYHRTWPFTDADAFGYRPELVPSRPDRGRPSVARHDDEWQTGDAFWLASDAVAAWLMEAEITDLHRSGPDEVRARLAEARAAGALRNDDLTFVIVHLTGEPPAGTRPSTVTDV